MTSRNPFLAGKGRPVVVGHRGVPRLHQENTLAGFRRAARLGIPAVELDVQLTADGRAVVLHDANLSRLTGDNTEVAAITWDRLSRLRIRRELPMGIGVDGAPAIVRYDREEPIPLLAEVLAEVAGRVAINVELKLDTLRWWQVEVGAVVAQVIAEAGAQDRVIVTSFDVRKLRAARRVQRDLAVGFCFDDGMLDFARPLIDGIAERLARRARSVAAIADDRLTDTDAATLARHPARHVRRALARILDSHVVGRFLGSSRLVGAEHTLVGAATVQRLHGLGVAIGTHTLFPLGSTTGKPIAPSAMTDREAQRLASLGVDWIESDDPERLLEIIGA